MCVCSLVDDSGASGRDAASMGICAAAPKEKRAAQVHFPSFSDPDATTVILVLLVKTTGFVLLKVSISKVSKWVLSTLLI